MIRLIAVLATVSIAGCATLSDEECRYADWYAIGMGDGREGRLDSRLARHAEACEKHGVRPDAEAWRAGWREGLLGYCSPQSGWHEGVAGTSYNGVCGPPLEEDFMFGYRPGRALYEVRNALEGLDVEIEALEALVVDDETETDARRGLMEDLRNLQREARELEAERALIEAEAAERGLF